MLPASDRNESNAFQILPALQASTDTPQLLGLLLRKRGSLHADRVFPRPIECNTGRDNGITILDEYALSAREHAADLSILLGQIFEIVHNEWLSGKLIDLCVIIRIQQDCTIGFS